MPTLHYIQYSRRSSDEKSNKQLQSIEGQEEALAEVVRSGSFQVVEKLQESRTAKEPGRPVFNAMIERIKHGKANAILCWHLDRLTRNELDSGTIRWLLRNGIIKEIRTPHRVYRPEDSVLITAVESAMGEQFIVDLIQKTNRGMRLKCAKGGIPFMAPEGYVNNRLDKTVEVDKERFPLIQKAFQLVLTQTYTVKEIHRLMTEDWGYRKKPNKNNPGGVLGLSSLHHILSNTFYAGYYTWQGEAYVHNLPRAVTQSEFERVQKILHKRSHKVGNKKAATDRAAKPRPWRTYTYTGLLTCVTCGQTVTAEVSKGHVYYHCCNKFGICTKKGMREEAVDAQVDELLKSVTLVPEFEAIASEVLGHFRSQDVAMKQTILESKQRALANLKQQRDALLSLYLQGHLEVEEFAEKKLMLSKQEAACQIEEEQSDQAFKKADETIENVAYFVTHARNLFQAGDPHLRRFIATHLGDHYLFNNGTLQIELHPLFGPVRSEFKVGLKNFERDRTGPNDAFKPVGANKMDRLSQVSPLWLPTLEEYRNFILREQLCLPKLPTLE